MRDWEVLGPVLERALELEPTQREGYVRRRLADDPDALERALALLAAEEDDQDFLLAPRVAEQPAGTPRRAGPFRLERLLGQGGMGAVWLGRREGDFEQRVAVKLLRPGSGGGRALTRFLRERRLLAQLEHPGIARLVDGGVAEDGSPYLALEYVDGLPLDRHVAEHGLDLRGRLELVVAVCEAVAAAHDLGIVHRDLKPSNVLVSAGGQPRLIDFGIARAREFAGETLTLTGERLMTPRYAAPEQVGGRPTGPATDVHALGGLLYQVLTDRPPVGREATTLAEIEEVVLHGDPPRPSRAPAPGLRGVGRDLDLIVARARALEPDRRYADARGLAEDLRRFLEGRPVHARPDSALYRARRFVGRHRLLVLSAVAVFLALGGGLVVALVQYREAEARREETAAALAEEERQRDLAAAIGAFMTEDLLLAADPERTANPDMTLREAMERAEPRIAERFASMPLAEAAVRQAYGTAYLGLSLPASAEPHLARARELRLAQLGPDAHETLESGRDLARALEDLGQLEEALELHEEVHRRMVAIHGADDGYTMVVTSNLAQAYQEAGRPEEAERLYRELLELRLAAFGERHENTLTTMNTLAVLLVDLGRLEEALPLIERTARLREELLGAGDPAALRARGNLAAVQFRLGRLDEAHEAFERVHAGQTTSLGKNHAQTLQTLNNLAVVAYGRGDHAAQARYRAREWEGWRDRGEGTGERALVVLDGYVEASAAAGELEGCAATLEGWLAEALDDDGLRTVLDERLARALAGIAGPR